MSAAPRLVPTSDAAEWEARVHLAAAFRIANRYGWNEGVANHFSMMLPGSDDRYLLNPRGMHFSELTASNLMVVDGKGNKISGYGEVRPVAFYLHGRLHQALPKARCIIHAHPPYATAIAMIKGGRIPNANGIMQRFAPKVAYDDAYGGPVNDEECDRIIKLVGECTVLFHAMHGLTTMGECVANAVDEFYFIERMCQYAVLAMQTGRELHEIPAHMLNGRYDDGFGVSNMQVHFDALLRLLDREEPSYKT